jgi:hypothetical protein
MDYERDMHIDESSLDVEWLEQASLAVRWGKYYSECQEEFDAAEENVKIVRSDLILEINKNPEQYLGKDVKLTDMKVEAAYRLQKKHIEAKERWIRAKKKLMDAEVIKNEISFTRKAALENLVQLYISQYFAGPKVPRNLTQEREKIKDRFNKKVRIRSRNH